MGASLHLSRKKERINQQQGVSFFFFCFPKDGGEVLQCIRRNMNASDLVFVFKEEISLHGDIRSDPKKKKKNHI